MLPTSHFGTRQHEIRNVKTMITPVILCGGSGTRLWPRSRKAKPKPFLPLVGETTLFEASVLRCSIDAGFAPPIVVTGAQHLDHVVDQLPDPAASQIIVEPEGKNTAAIALAALRCLPMRSCWSAPAITTSAIAMPSRLQPRLRRSWPPMTGWYPSASPPPHRKPALAISSRAIRSKARRPQGGTFVEKPDLERAQAFLADGGYAWNGGIFAFRAGHFLDELGSTAPILQARCAQRWTRAMPMATPSIPIQPNLPDRRRSVDYAVMEKTDRAAMVPATMAWSDIGNWQALHEALDKDDVGNAVKGRVELKTAATCWSIPMVRAFRWSAPATSSWWSMAMKSWSARPKARNWWASCKGRQPMSKLPIRDVRKALGQGRSARPFPRPKASASAKSGSSRPPMFRASGEVHLHQREAVGPGSPERCAGRRGREKDRGKEECWLVIDAEPGATLGVGFNGHVDHDTMRAAALDGSIEDMLVWHPVKPGDFFYIPANTVHAIGAGVSVIEIQQNSDITYRLYDYGRPRELHLDAGIAVSRGEPLDPALHRHIPDTGTVELASGAYFTAHRSRAARRSAACRICRPIAGHPRSGSVTLGDDVLNPGDCASAASIDALTFDPQGQAIIVRPAT
jgi:mannose-6-phosphate isomerase